LGEDEQNSRKIYAPARPLATPRLACGCVAFTFTDAMTRPSQQLWDCFKRYEAAFPTIGQPISRRRMNFASLLQAALQGFDIDAMLRRTKARDDINRITIVKANRPVLLDLFWKNSGNDNGAKYFVISPYMDRLGLFPPYFRQTVNESFDKKIRHYWKTVWHAFQYFGLQQGKPCMRNAMKLIR